MEHYTSELKEIPLGNKPLVVLTALEPDDALRGALSSEDFNRFQKIWYRRCSRAMVDTADVVREGYLTFHSQAAAQYLNDKPA